MLTPSMTSDDLRYEAIRARDPKAAGFFLAVRTTKIYCRPDCPARTPLRKNVAFFEHRADAERAGYRACKRCRPNVDDATDPTTIAIENACRTIDRAESAPSLAELAADAGLSVFHFQRAFTKRVGVSPKQYALALRARFHAAELVPDDRALRSDVRAATQTVEGRSSAQSLSLDIRGTAFQRRVWQELTAIPRGETRTYAQLAIAVGKPTAARAVANACASNSLAVAVPCHRVVRGDGGVGGYRWGTERKSAILARERKEVS